MKLKITILPAKVLADGTHRIRIAMSHNGNTRYFMTRFTVPSPKNVAHGSVTGVNNAAYINQQLMRRMTEIYKTFDALEDTDYLTCSQLLKLIEDKIRGEVPVTLHQVADLYIKLHTHTVARSTLRIDMYAETCIKMFFAPDFQMKQLTTGRLYDFRDFMANRRKLNPTSQNMYIKVLRQMVSFATQRNMVKYETSPFDGFVRPKVKRRDVAITLDELRTLRDFTFTGRQAEAMTLCRDIFMLSFYLCGMNYVDICNVDFSGKSVKFIRQKTVSRRHANETTEFDIQPEARAILDRWYVEGRLSYKGKLRKKENARLLFRKYYPLIAKECGIKTRLIYYSARKTFAQLANELMIKDSVIEYCIGDSVTSSKNTIGFYIHVNKRMADAAVRKVLDAVASDKAMEEMMGASPVF